MKNSMKAAILLLTTLLISTSQVVLADEITDAIEDVRGALNTTDRVNDGPYCQGLPSLADHRFVEKICGGLNKKLNDADAKHGDTKRPKDADAKKKLCDFGTTLFNLANRDKQIITWDEYGGVYSYLLVAQGLVNPSEPCIIDY
jgi:hypothetical protein